VEKKKEGIEKGGEKKEGVSIMKPKALWGWISYIPDFAREGRGGGYSQQTNQKGRGGKEKKKTGSPPPCRRNPWDISKQKGEKNRKTQQIPKERSQSRDKSSFLFHRGGRKGWNLGECGKGEGEKKKSAPDFNGEPDRRERGKKGGKSFR